jgi:type I restriction enzyme, S subunit
MVVVLEKQETKQAVATRTIEEIVEALIDYRGKTPPKTTDGIRLITAKVIKDGRITEDNFEYIDEDYYDTWMRRGLPKYGDVLITEAPLGEVARLRLAEKIALAQRVILLRGKESIIDNDYLFYALRSPFAQAELYSRSSGTTVLGIKQSELRQVKIPYFELSIQQKIASILSAYDDLIENNLRRIKLLEDMAQALYREWFVHFRYPGHEQVPLIDSGCPNFGDPIPQGWKVKKLGDVADDVRHSVSVGKVDPETPYVGLEHIPRKTMALSEWGKAEEVQSSKLAFKQGEILFCKIRPYFHKVCVAPVDGVCSTDAIVIVPKKPQLFSLVLSVVFSEDFVAHATQTSQGTKMPRANWNVLTQYPVIIPPNDALSRFNAIVLDIVQLQRNLVFRNRNLRQTRDLLLPRLISGQLDVSELEVG